MRRNQDLRFPYQFLVATPVDLEFNQVRKLKWQKKLQDTLNYRSKAVRQILRLQLSSLGQRGINIVMEFCKAFNEKTKAFMGKPVPVVITVYKDKKFDFVIKSPPASHIREAAKLKSGSKNLVE